MTTIFSLYKLKSILEKLVSKINSKAEKTDVDAISSILDTSTTDNNKVLMVVNGAPSWQSVQVFYSSTSEPQNSTGSDGDIYLVTE